MDVASVVAGKTLEALGVQTNYHEQGGGAPVVLLHGSGLGVSAYANWARTIPVLAKHFRVIAPDCAGFGHSDPADDIVFGMDYWVRHMVAFLDAIGVERASFIGNSFGGALAVAIAAQHPNRVDRLMLMGSAGVDFVPPPVFGIDLSKGLTGEVMLQIVRMFTYHPDQVTDEMVQLRLQTALRPGAMARQARLFPGEARISRVTSLITPAQLVATIERPTLLVHGRDDRIVPPATSFRLHELIAGSDLHIFSRCGHWSQVDRFDEFNALATSFLSQS